MERMVLRQGVKEIAGVFLFSATSFLLVNYLLFVVIERSSNSETRRATKHEKLELQDECGFETVVGSYPVSSLCLWNLWAQLAHGEGTAESDGLGFFDLMAGSFWKGQMLRLGDPLWCLSGALRENPFLTSLFPVEAWTQFSLVPEGKGKQCQIPA